MKNIKTILTITLAAITLLFGSCKKNNIDANGCFYDIDEATTVANKKNQDIMIIITLDGDDEDSTDFMDKVVRDSKFKEEILFAILFHVIQSVFDRFFNKRFVPEIEAQCQDQAKNTNRFDKSKDVEDKKNPEENGGFVDRVTVDDISVFLGIFPERDNAGITAEDRTE